MELELMEDSEPEKQPDYQKKAIYKGFDRRNDLRRVTVDRREMIRFEERSDRRQRERRCSLNAWQGHDFIF